jgi:anti-sigma B factor antagonist
MVMAFKAEEVDGVLIISTPHMDLDASTADEFKRTVGLMVAGHQKVAVDLGEIGFMDSAGLGAIISLCKTVRSGGGEFRVFGLTEAVKSLFELVRVHRLFDVCADRESVLCACRE